MTGNMLRSLLYIRAKVAGSIIKSLVKIRLVTHFLFNSVLCKAQFDFLPERLTSSNLFYIDRIIYKELQKRKSADDIIFDISNFFLLQFRISLF